MVRKSTLIGAALLPSGKDVVVVKLYRPVGNNDAHPTPSSIAGPGSKQCHAVAEAMAGIPSAPIPTGRAADQDGKPGQPTGIFITGPYLSDGQVLAVGYALEQALNVQLQPALDATIQQIEAVTGQKSRLRHDGFN